MVFSSTTFLLLFLPAVMLGVLLCPRLLRNTFLLLASLLFYAWGETVFVLLMLLSICMNYLLGAALAKRVENAASSRWLLGLGVALNLGLLAWFKYANFLADNLNALLVSLSLPALQLSKVHLPLGISFFTFQAISYLVDVYRREADHDRNPINVALYIALFPQLIAGPIVRYHDVADQLRNRVLSLKLVHSGAQRFVYGLSKKLLIANPLGELADTIFAVGGDDLTAPVAWLGLVCYTLQIYFDFSGYSDMAIGLGRMLGFRFKENFNYPYIANSVQDFWRRWHISLSNWFRDYLYIPLGGNRTGPVRTYANLFIVFFLCGLWHGASWNFVIWGLLHGAFLVIERVGFSSVLSRLPRPLVHTYVLLVVMIGWVFFRCETLPEALAYLGALFNFAGAGLPVYTIERYLDNRYLLVLSIALLLSTPMARRLQGAWIQRSAGSFALLQPLWMGVLMLMSIMSLAASAYNPFIYFRF